MNLKKIVKKISQFSEGALRELTNGKGTENENISSQGLLAGAANYTNSSLVNYTKISPNRNSPRNHSIDTITIHCVEGQCSVQTLGDIFYPSSRQCSSNYGIGYDGKVGMYCEEKDRSWCSSSGDNDHRAITIEVASDTTPPYAVRDVAYDATIKLVTDICQRNGIKKLIWSTNKADRVNHVNGCNMTVHKDFTDTSCPGEYLYTRMGDIAEKVNANLNASTTTVKTYTVHVPITRYSSASDAKAEKNPKGTYQPGTYYIYNGYPDGYNGVYNITEDKTGKTAGSWINPAQNVKPSTGVFKTGAEMTLDNVNLYISSTATTPVKTVTGTYYVWSEEIIRDRIKITNSAKNAGISKEIIGWINFSDSGLIKDDSTTTPTPPNKEPEPEKEPEEPKPTESTKVYDLDFPNPVQIVGLDDRTQSTKGNCAKAIKKILSNNPNFDINIAKAFFKIAPVYRVDPMIAISQSVLETGWFKFEGSSVKPEQHNYCGLGATGGGVSGAAFDTIEEGVTAQLQHLYAYGTTDPLPAGQEVVDPRFSKVSRGVAKYWQQLAGRWAVPGWDSKYGTPEEAMKAGQTYGQKILTLFNTLSSVTVSEEEVNKYFPEEETIDPSPEPTPNPDDENSENVNIILKLIRRLLEFFVHLFGLDKEE